MKLKNIRKIRNVSIIVILLCLLIAYPVSGHNSGSTTGTGISVLVSIVIITCVSAVIGIISTVLRGRFNSPIEQVHSHRIIAVLFIIIGLTAVGSIMMERITMGVVGAYFGLLFGTILSIRSAGSACSTTAIGSIMIHRFIEGSALASISITGEIFGIFTVITLTTHATIECVSLSGYQRISRIGAIGSILAVTFSLVIGFILGSLGIRAANTIATDLIISIIGGLLAALGISEV